MKLSDFTRETGITIRPYQARAIKAWLDSGRRGVIVMPTGAGKTYTALPIIYAYYKAGASVLIATPTIALARQWADKLRSIGINTGEAYTGHKLIGLVTVTVYNTMVMQGLKASLIVLDEAHHARTDTALGRYIDKLDAHILGLTATPERSMVLRVVFHLGFTDLKGYVSNLRITPIPVRDYYTLYRIREVEKKISRVKSYMEDADVQERKSYERELQRLYALRRIIASSSDIKKAKVVELVKSLAREYPGERIIVWTESTQVADELHKLIPGSTVIHSNIPPSERAEALEAFRRGESRILIAVRILDEGIDLPEAGIGVFAGTGLIERRLIQRTGRVLRKTHLREDAHIYFVYIEGSYEERALNLLKHATRDILLL